MTKMKIFLAVFTLCIGTWANAQTGYKTLLKDFQHVSGSWKGSLTYLDYTSGKPYTMPADMVVNRIGNTNQFAMANIYPNETSANSIDTLIISTDGRLIDNAMVTSRKKRPNGDIEIITEETGRDGNDHKPATFRHTYTIGKSTFKKRKDVQFVGETAWINRHEYTFTKIPVR